MDARFEIRLAEGDRRDLRNCCDVSGLPAAAIVRFGLKWAINRLDVLARGGALETERAITAFIDEMRSRSAAGCGCGQSRDGGCRFG